MTFFARNVVSSAEIIRQFDEGVELYGTLNRRSGGQKKSPLGTTDRGYITLDVGVQMMQAVIQNATVGGAILDPKIGEMKAHPKLMRAYVSDRLSRLSHMNFDIAEPDKHEYLRRCFGRLVAVGAQTIPGTKRRELIRISTDVATPKDLRYILDLRTKKAVRAGMQRDIFAANLLGVIAGMSETECLGEALARRYESIGRGEA